MSAGKSKLTEDDLHLCAHCKETGRDSEPLLIPSQLCPGQWQVRCSWCDNETISWPTRSEAVEVWNDIYSVIATEETRNK